MADPQRRSRRTRGRGTSDLYLHCIGKSVEVTEHDDGKYYTSHPLLEGPFDSPYHLEFEARNLFPIDRRKPDVVMQGEPSNQAPGSRRVHEPPLMQEAVTEDPPSAERVSALTMHPQDEFTGTVAFGESGTASPQQSDSCLGSKILIRRPPPNWYQTHLVRMDRSGSFWTYPDLGGPYQSIDEADDAINRYFDELQQQAMLKEQDDMSAVDRIIYKHNYYPDGTPKRGPNSPGKTSTARDGHNLSRALVDQYNEENNLYENCAHELEKVVKKTWIIEENMCYFHLNFITKRKETDDIYLFFAEVSRTQQEHAWDVTCCRMIDSNEDNGHCFGCHNNGSPDMKHPNDKAYTGGHKDVCLPLGENKTNIDFDNLEAEEARLRARYRDFDPDRILRLIEQSAMEENR